MLNAEYQKGRNEKSHPYRWLRSDFLVIRMRSYFILQHIGVQFIITVVQNKMYHKMCKLYHKTHLNVYVKFPYSRMKHFLTQHFDFAM